MLSFGTLRPVLGQERSCLSLLSQNRPQRPKAEHLQNSRYPNQFRVIGATRVFCKVPILYISEPPRMAVEEYKLSAFIVQIGMDIILLGNAGKFSVIEQPDNACRRLDGR